MIKGTQCQLELPDVPVDEETALTLSGLADAADLRKWPARLLELAEVFEARLGKLMAHDLSPREIAQLLVLELAHNQGGRPVYLPSGEALDNLLRARRIFRDAGTRDERGNTWTMDRLATREKICVQQAYKDYAQIRELERNREPKLF